MARDGAPTADRDYYLAFAPWRDAGARYLHAFREHWIDSARQSDYVSREAIDAVIASWGTVVLSGGRTDAELRSDLEAEGDSPESIAATFAKLGRKGAPQ